MAKRRRKAVGAALLLAILLLGWQGLGWLDGDPDAEGDGEGDRDARALVGPGAAVAVDGAGVGNAAGAAAAVERDPGAGAPDASPSAELAGGGVARPDADAAVAAPTAEGTGGGVGVSEPTQPEVVRPDPAADRGRPFEADRARGLLQVAELSRANGLIGEGYRAADELAGMALDAEWEQQVDAVRGALAQALERRVEALEGAIARGEVMTARALLEPLRLAGHERVADAMAALSARRGWPDLLGGGDGGGAVDGLPAPKNLRAQRVVDWHREAPPVRARVVDSRGLEVTLKIRSERGITFPNARRTELEPVEATGEERVEQSLAAFAAGDGVLGRLWFAAACAVGGEGDGREALELMLLKGG